MRKLVFNFYICKNWRENIVYTIHFNCLKRYKDCFDEVYFAISTQEASDIESIKEVKNRLLEIFENTKKITFEIVENNPQYCEVPTFKREIVDRLGEDTLVFFGHLKGVMDIYKENPEDIYRRICGLYYFSLEEEKENKGVSKELLSNVGVMSHGAFMTRFLFKPRLKNKYSWYYGGTFFWINSKRIKEFMNNNNIELPIYSDRFYAENFLGNIYPAHALENNGVLTDALFSSYKQRFFNNSNPNYVDFNAQIEWLIEGEEDKFNNFVEDMKKV